MANEPTTPPTVLPDRPSLPGILFRAALTSGGRPGGAGTLPPKALKLVDLAIDRENLLSYQHVCHTTANDLIPPPYPHLLAWPLQAAIMAQPEFPLPMPGLVHTFNEITLHRVLTADDRLDVTVRAADLAPHAKGTTVDLLSRVESAGEVVWESRSRYLHRGTPAGEPRAEAAPPGVPEGLPNAQWRLPADLGRRYAGISGDVNPIHLHPWAARLFGFHSAIAHGMWTYARTLALWGHQLRHPHTSRVWFRKPVFLPSRVAVIRRGDVAAVVMPKDPHRMHALVEFVPTT